MKNQISTASTDKYLYTSTYADIWNYDLGVFSWYGLEPLVQIRGNLNTDAYCTFLDDNVLPTLWQFCGMNPYYFQDDNASYHVARLTKSWYGAEGVHRMDWPVQSPDLNSFR